jgi:UDP-N-acetylglucosamine 3-dehydrogenase
MRTIGYGVIGLGFFGEKHLQVATSLPNIEVLAVCTRRDQRRKELRKRFEVPRDYRDYNDLLADPAIEAVSVVTHVDDHLAPVLAALRAGKHVLVEKPMARTVAECDQMIAAAAKANRVLMVGHICRFNPRYALARESIRRGELGKVVSLFARRNIPAARSKEVLENIGPLLGDAIHDTDLMLWMTDSKIVSVYAQTHSLRGLKHPDLGWTMYRFENGAIGVCETNWFLPEGTPFRIHEALEVAGTHGAVYIQGSDMNLTVQSRRGIDSPDTLYWPEVHGHIVGALRDELAYFADCVSDGLQPAVVTLADARAAVAAVAAAEKSALTGKPVKVS